VRWQHGDGVGIEADTAGHQHRGDGRMCRQRSNGFRRGQLPFLHGDGVELGLRAVGNCRQQRGGT